MNNITAVDVFLGHPLVDATEKHLLQRLRRDLAVRGISARILANLQVGSDFRELDFFIISDDRAVMCELKGYGNPVVARANGRWQYLVNGRLLPLEGNAYRQAQDGGYALSDEMRAFARATGAPGPTKDKFVKDFELVVCLYPSIHQGSDIDRHRWVRAVGYDELLARLEQPGPRPAWSEGHWDAFVRHLGLYRDGEDAESARALRVSTAAVDEYSARFVNARQSCLPPLVPTSVHVAGALTDRPDLASTLTAGHDLLLHGASGQGKTLWASYAAVALGSAGQLPIWLPAGAYEDDFATFLARAIAPYTTLTAAQIVAAARAAGRGVALIVDGLNECPETLRASLIAGVQAVRLRASSHSVLVTAQRVEELPAGLSLQAIELRSPGEAERRAILATDGAEWLVDGLAGFETPFDLTLAAACADDLAQPVSPVELLDVYVDRVTDGEPTRAALRSIAWRMHQELRLSVRAAAVVRSTRRELGLTVDEIRQALSCQLLTVVRGRVAFRHERFASFLAAEALLLSCGDGQAAARALNEPRSTPIRRDAVGLESDDCRLGDMLGAVEDHDLLVTAVEGRLGELARRTAMAMLVDALHIASARAASAEIRFVPGAAGPVQDAWQMPWTLTPSETAQLMAAGRCLRGGLLLDEAARLVEQTDALCTAWETGAGGRPSNARGRTFVATYASGRPASDAALPATIVVRACDEDRFRSGQRTDASAVARALMARTPASSPGVLLLAMSLLRPVFEDGADLVVPLVAACLASDADHLRLEALQLVEESARRLDPDAHEAVLAAVRDVETDNIFLSSAVVEALAALGDIQPSSTVDDLVTEIRGLLARPDDPLAWRQAVGAVSSQFEDEDIVGPYHEAIRSLDDTERDVLFAMALHAARPDDIHVGWLLEQIDGLDEPRLRSAVLDFLGRVDPFEWHSTQWGIASTLLALRSLAHAGVPRPQMRAKQEAAAWETFVDVIDGLLRHGSEQAEPAQANEDHCRRLVTEHRSVVADLLSHLRSARVVMWNDDLDLEAQLVGALGDELVEVLVWSLEHPDQLRSPFHFSWQDDRSRHIVEVLGRVGDARAADALRRFADDRTLGVAAAEAVREIEARR